MGELDVLAEAEAHVDEGRCNVCNKKFWNNFFSPRYPGLFLILLFVLLDTFYACIFILMSTYYDNFSNTQHVGYFTQLWANILVIIAGFLSIHFLTLSPANMKFSYCLFLHAAMILALLLGMATIFIMLDEPSIAEIKAHTYRYVNVYHRAPYMTGTVFREKQCCGFHDFTDVIPVTNIAVGVNGTEKKKYYRVPPSCCKKDLYANCTEWSEEILVQEEFQANKSIYLNSEPCLKDSQGYDYLKTTEAYQTYLKTVYGAIPIFPITFAILGVLNYYIWYKFPRMPLNVRPIQFLEDVRLFVTCKCLRLKRSLEAHKRKESLEKEQFMEKVDGKKNISDFHMRHNMIMQSIANMRTLNRELRKEAQEERQLEAANRSGNILNAHGSGHQVGKPTSKHNILHKGASKHDHHEKHHEVKKVKLGEKPDPPKIKKKDEPKKKEGHTEKEKKK